MGSLTHFRSALANVGTTPVHWLACGDSVTEGSTATTISNRYINKLAAKLQAVFNPASSGGAGFENVFFNNATLQASAWTYSPTSGGANSAGLLGFREYSFAANATATHTFTGTSATYYFFRGAGSLTPFTATIDGGAPQTITPPTTGPADDRGSWSTGTLTAGAHTVVFTPQSGQQLFLRGVHVYNNDTTRGVHLWENGHYGDTTTTYLSGAGSVGELTDPLNLFTPDLVTIFLGLNDWQSGVVPATYQANLQTLISNIRGLCSTPPSFLLITPYARTDVTSPAYPLSQYVAACATIAASDAAVDYYDLSASFVPASVPTQMADAVHPNDTGHDTIANLIYPKLTIPATRWIKRYNGTAWRTVPLRRTA